MKETPGSVPLTPEQQQVYADKFGFRFLAIAMNSQAANRAERRQRKHKPRAVADRLAELELDGLAIRKGID